MLVRSIFQHVLISVLLTWARIYSPDMLSVRQFLSAFAKLCKAAVSFVMSVLSVSPHGTTFPLDGFSWNLIFLYFSKSVEKIRVLLDFFYFTWRPIFRFFFIFSAQFFLEWRILQTKVVEKIKTRILCSVPFFFDNCAVYEIMWKKIPQNQAAHRRQYACWIPKTTHTRLTL